MRQLLIEGLSGAQPFIVDRNKPFVTESRAGGSTTTRIPGRFSLCDSVNGNGRKYPQPVWQKNLAEGSALQASISKNAAFGLLEHPKDGQVTLNSPICILVTDAKLQPGTNKDGASIMEVVGEITVLGTADGQKLTALIDAGYNPLVSSRGFGSVIKDNQGIDVVQEDYICEGWDVVMKPSFETAELNPPRAAAESVPAKPEKALAENVPAKPTLPEGAPPAPAAAPAAATTPKPLTETIMDINTIKSRISSFRSTKVPTDPHQFSEGLQEMANLHQDIANYVAEDGKRSYHGMQLHDSLKVVESAWSATAQQPAKQASRLNENYRKVLRVTKVLGETAVNFKKKLSESIKRNAESGALVEELTKRGTAWVDIADKRKAQVEELTHKLNVACEALDIMTGRYHEDVTDLGRRLLTVEFADKVKVDEVATALKEAKHPKDIVAIREKLEGKKPAAPAVNENQKPGTPAKPSSSAPAAPAAPAAPNLDEARVLVPSTRSITESVDMVKRLSAASAK